MALVKCPDCGREVSSEAPSCPQCARPFSGKAGLDSLKAEPPAKKSSYRPLAALFLFISIGCVIGGYEHTKETFGEESYRRLTERVPDEESVQKLVALGMPRSEAYSKLNKMFDASNEGPQATLEKMQHERELRLVYFFVPASVLGILGLVLWAKH